MSEQITIETPLGPMEVHIHTQSTVHGSMIVTHPTAKTEWEVDVPVYNAWREGFKETWGIKARKVGGAGDFQNTFSGVIHDLVKEQLQPVLAEWANAHLDDIAAIDRANQIARLTAEIANLEESLALKRQHLESLLAS